MNNNNNYKLKKYTHKILNSINKNLNKNSLYWNHLNYYLNNKNNFNQIGGTQIDEIIKLFQKLDDNIIKKILELELQNEDFRKKNIKLQLKHECMLKENKQVKDTIYKLTYLNDSNTEKFIKTLAVLYNNIKKICKDKDTFLCKSYNDKSYFIQLFEILKEKDENKELFNKELADNK